jgi:hypothetical protein
MYRTTQNFGRVRAMPHLCRLYPGICLTTQEKVRENLRLILTCFISIGHLTDTGSMNCIYVNMNECESLKNRSEGFDCICSAQNRQIVGCCENSDEHRGYVKGAELLDRLTSASFSITTLVCVICCLLIDLTARSSMC